MNEEHPFADRRVRSAMGLFSATIVLVVAFLFVDGVVRWAMVGVAAIDLVATPYILGLAMEQQESDEPSGFEG